MPTRPNERARARVDSPPPPPSDPKPEVSRLAVTLTPDGGVEFEGMRAATRDKLRAALPSIQRELAPASPAAPAPGLPEPLAHALTHALGQLEYIVIARATKAPRAVLDQVVPFTPAEHAALDPLIGRVFGKYAGGWLSKYEDEAALAIVLLTLTQQKIAGVAQIMQASRGPATVHSIDRSTPTPAIDVPADPAPESRE